MDAMTALRSMMVTEELKPAGDEVGQERKPFSGWKVKIEYEATDSDGQSYRSEYWFIMDKEAQCVIRSFDTLSRILCKWKQDSVVSLFLYLDSVFKNKRLVSLGLLISLFPHVRKQFPVFF